MFSNSNIHKHVLICALSALLLNNVSFLKGQAATATILGTVTDMSGAAIPGATVQAKNVGTGVTLSTTSDPQGRFRIPDLGVGEYQGRCFRSAT